MGRKPGHLVLIDTPAGVPGAPAPAAGSLFGTLSAIDDLLAGLTAPDALGMFDALADDMAGVALPTTAEEVLDYVLVEAEQAVATLRSPLEAEIWGSEMLGLLGGLGMGKAAIDDAFADAVVPAAEAARTPTALTVLGVLGVLGSPRLAGAAALSQRRLVEAGVSGPVWTAGLGHPKIGPCWAETDVFGGQEVVVATFAYGRKRHGICVLVDHDLGGGVKDAYLTVRVPTLRKQMFARAEDDPITYCDEIDPADAADRLARAIVLPECPRAFDQVQSLNQTRALLHARVRLMSGAPPER